MNEVLPDGWGVGKFEHVIKSITNGLNGAQNKDGLGLPITRIETIANQDINLDKVGYISEYNIEALEKYLLKSNDILFSHINSPAHLGKTAIFPSNIENKIYHGVNLLRIVIEDKTYIPKLFNYFCKYIRAKGLFSLNAQHAVNQASLNQKKIISFDILIPPLAEQQEIATRLDDLLAQVDVIKARLDATPAILKRFRQAVLAAAVSGELLQLDNPKIHWIKVSLCEIAQEFSYGTSAKSSKEGLVPVLRMGNIQGGVLIWDDLVYTSDKTEIKKYQLEKNDILFNRTNSPELVGKTAIYKGERNAIYAGYLIKIKCSSSLNPDFLNIHLNSPQGRNYCWEVKSDGVSQSNINAKKIAAYPMELPPLPEQTEIVNRVEQLFAFADQIEQQVQAAQTRVNQLTQSILAKAFKGELTADWRAANPELISGENSAEALLEKINATQTPAKPKRGSLKLAI